MREPVPVEPDVVITLTRDEAQRLFNLLYHHEAAGGAEIRRWEVGKDRRLLSALNDLGFYYDPRC